jgi:Ca2+-binding EF-hand superfamily protein
MEPADFAALDRDRDGAISRAEAAANPYLVDNWRRLDSDGDDRLDRAEFSAFERTFKDGLQRIPPTSRR